MRLHLRLSLAASLLLMPMTAHAIAFATPPNTAPMDAAVVNGIWIDDGLKHLEGTIWPDMSAEEITEILNTVPERNGSRTLNKLMKAVIASPVTLPEGEDDLTALRLKKLLAMGGIDEAKELATSLDDDSMSPAVLDQTILTLLANGGKEAVCLDLLAYKSDSAEKFAALADDTKALVDECTAPATTTKTSYTLSEFKELSDVAAAQAAWNANGSIVEDEDMTGIKVFEAFRDLSPFKQSLIMHSPYAAVSIQWRMLPFSVRHDLVDVDQASQIYMGAAISGQNIALADVRAKAKDQSGFQRLPLYYKTLKSYTKDVQPPVSELATDILASASTYDMYGLLPFVSYFDDVDLSTLSSRKAFVAALALGLEGDSPTGSDGKIDPSESPWILTVLTHDQAFTEAGFDTWANAHLDTLLNIAPRLKTRLFLLLDEISGETGKSSAYIKHYDNTKSLTPQENYVMHDVLALSRAKQFADDKAVGPMIIALANADGNIRPDLLDPQGMVEMIRLLNDSGLTQSAKTLAMESLVFKMSVTTADGE